MAKIDIDKFIISLCENGFGTLGMGDIRNALREQGLKCEKGELLESNKELKLTEFEPTFLFLQGNLVKFIQRLVNLK